MVTIVAGHLELDSEAEVLSSFGKGSSLQWFSGTGSPSILETAILSRSFSCTITIKDKVFLETGKNMIHIY